MLVDFIISTATTIASTLLVYLLNTHSYREIVRKYKDDVVGEYLQQTGDAVSGPVLQELHTQQDEKLRTSAIIGPDLSIMAFGLDVVFGGMLYSQPAAVTFFRNWDTSEVSYALPIWLGIAFIHLCLMLMSMRLRHGHEITFILDGAARTSPRAPRHAAFISDCLGFLAFLTTVIILINPWRVNL